MENPNNTNIGGLVGTVTRQEEPPLAQPTQEVDTEEFEEGMCNFTVAATALADVMRAKGGDKLNHHTEEVILKTLGTFPRDSEGYEVVRWTLLMERCLTANNVNKMQDVLRILYRIILDPNITNKFRESFLPADPPTFVDDDERPEHWRRDWAFPITENMDNIVTWAARFLLASCVPIEILREIVRKITPIFNKQSQIHTIRNKQSPIV